MTSVQTSVFGAFAAIAMLAGTSSALAAPSAAETQGVEALAVKLAAELKAACPIVSAENQPAFEACRKTLFGPSTLRKSISGIVLWGRQNKKADLSLKESNLSQFSPDVWTGMYVPLFMFDGTQQVNWVEREKMFQIKLGATFRNRLAPGQFPYPFWHEEAKWSAYENTSALLLWVTPNQVLKAVQFRWQDGPLPGVAVTPQQHPKHDGQWLWTDSAGKTQPAVTLFDGLYSPNNPYKKQLESDYRSLAISLRESQCFTCHTPDNTDNAKRLVLLQTPAHAAGEISRILKSVRQDRMPREENTGIEQPLDEKMKNDLLTLGTAFEKSVNQARQWEADHAGDK